MRSRQENWWFGWLGSCGISTAQEEGTLPLFSGICRLLETTSEASKMGLAWDFMGFEHQHWDIRKDTVQFKL